MLTSIANLLIAMPDVFMAEDRLFNATKVMINSGALPNVALSNLAMASPVRMAICSVACTTRPAIGVMASAAERRAPEAALHLRARERR